jgi:hypothetical protein
MAIIISALTYYLISLPGVNHLHPSFPSKISLSFSSFSSWHPRQTEHPRNDLDSQHKRVLCGSRSALHDLAGIYTIHPRGSRRAIPTPKIFHRNIQF